LTALVPLQELVTFILFLIQKQKYKIKTNEQKYLLDWWQTRCL